MHKPEIRTAGLDGLIVRFGTELSEPANRAALAFRAAVDHAASAQRTSAEPERQGRQARNKEAQSAPTEEDAPPWSGVEETSTSLVSTYLRFNPLRTQPETMRAHLNELLATRDWYDAPLPDGRTLWRIPTAFGGDLGPQFGDAAEAAGLGTDSALASLSQARVRVQTIGFAPGMPYLGVLPEAWDIPRQGNLTARVPAGGVCVALRQLVLFPVATPTGWRHIGQTHFRLFRPDAPTPFRLKAGDEVLFEPVSPDALAELADAPDGGASCEALP